MAFAVNVKQEYQQNNEEDSFEILSQEPSMVSSGASTFVPIEDDNLKKIVESIKKEVEQNNILMNQKPQSTDLSSLTTFDETHQELKGLIRENEELKNTIQQTNLSMKTNLEKIQLWKADVNKVFEANKEKLEQARIALNKSNEANAKMAMEVDKYRNIKVLQDEEIIHLKSQMVDCKKEENQSLFCVVDDNGEVEKLQKQILELKNELGKVLTECKTQEKTFENELKTKESTIVELTKQIEAINQENETALEIKENEILQLRKTNYQLQKDVVNNQKEYESNLKKQEETIRLANQLENASIRDSAVDFEQKDKEFKRELNLKDVKILKLQQEIEEHEIQQKELEKHLNNNVTLLRTELQLCKEKNVELQEQCNITNQQLLSAQQTITKLNEDIRNRTLELNSSVHSQDDYFALTQQLEVYKADFEAERSARESLIGEKNQLADDLTNIQRRNQQLQAEIDVIREEKNYVVVSNNSSNRPSPSPSATSQPNTSPKLTRFSCPLCSSQFRSLRLIEEHVEQCTGSPFD